jgi:hypothetical protein
MHTGSDLLSGKAATALREYTMSTHIYISLSHVLAIGTITPLLPRGFSLKTHQFKNSYGDTAFVFRAIERHRRIVKFQSLHPSCMQEQRTPANSNMETYAQARDAISQRVATQGSIHRL